MGKDANGVTELTPEQQDQILDEVAERLIGSEEKKKPKEREPSKYDLFARRVLRHFDEGGEQVRYSLNDWWFYQKGHWRRYSPAEVEDLECLFHEIADSLSIPYASARRDLITHMKTLWSFKFNSDHLNTYPYVAMKNGTLDVLSGEILKHDPEHYTTRSLDVTYDSEAECPQWLAMLDRIFDGYSPEAKAQLIRLMQEWFGVALLGSASGDLPRGLRKALFLHGPPNTGKSTILKVLQSILGTNNVVSASVHDVTARQFGLQTFLGREAWITEEIAGLAKLTDPTRLKCLITGETLTVDRKNLMPVELNFNGPVAWAANTVPNIGEYSDALYTRVLLIEVERVFSPAEAKKQFGTMQPHEWLMSQGEVPGIVAWAHKGFRRAMSRGQFEEIDELNISSSDWRSDNDPFYSFVQEHCSYDPSVMTEGTAITWLAMGYATAQGWEKLRYKRIGREVSEAIRSVFPQIEKPRRRVDGKKQYYWEGLRVSPAGQRYLDMMSDKDPNAEDSRSRINVESGFGKWVFDGQQTAD